MSLVWVSASPTGADPLCRSNEIVSGEELGTSLPGQCPGHRAIELASLASNRYVFIYTASRN